MTRIIICGGRDYADGIHMAEVLYEVAEVRSRNDVVIVHGGCSGADALAVAAAKTWGLPVEEHSALWDRYGSPQAAHIRNQEMVDAGADLLVAFPGGAGTADCVRRAKRAGIPVRQELARDRQRPPQEAAEVSSW